MHAAKRRRLDEASSTLARPFKSPFKTPSKQVLVTVPAKASVAIRNEDHEVQERSEESHATLRNTFSAPSTQDRSQPAEDVFSISTTTDLHIQNLGALQRQHTALLTKLSAARAQLDMSTQAHRIECSRNKTAELEALKTKWRSAARAAAEEVYSKIRDRVNKMGGTKGLQQKERDREERRREWEQEEREAELDRLQNERERRKDAREERIHEMRLDGSLDTAALAEEPEDSDDATEREDAWSGETVLRDPRADECQIDNERPVRDEDAGYSMDMMLESLNIDLEVIGFDKEVGAWTD